MATKKAPAKETATPAAKKGSALPAKKTAAVKKMTKSELIRLLADKMELTTKQFATFFDFLAEIAIQETRKTGEFMIPGLGKLVKAQRAARIGRNCQGQSKTRPVGQSKIRPLGGCTWRLVAQRWLAF